MKPTRKRSPLWLGCMVIAMLGAVLAIAAEPTRSISCVPYVVGLLADRAVDPLARELQRRGVRPVVPADETEVSRSRVVLSAGVIVLVVDAHTGPLPRVRADLALLRESDSRPPFFVMLFNADAVDDPEVLDLVEWEIRDTVSDHGLDGDALFVVRVPDVGSVRESGYDWALQIMHLLVNAEGT